MLAVVRKGTRIDAATASRDRSTISSVDLDGRPWAAGSIVGNISPGASSKIVARRAQRRRGCCGGRRAGRAYWSSAGALGIGRTSGATGMR